MKQIKENKKEKQYIDSIHKLCFLEHSFGFEFTLYKPIRYLDHTPYGTTLTFECKEKE